jgi:hypothetical protein
MEAVYSSGHWDPLTSLNGVITQQTQYESSFLWKPQVLYNFVEFEVHKAVTIKSAIFCHLMPCSLVEVYRCFIETYCHLLQGWRASKASNQLYLLHASCWLLGLPFNTEDQDSISKMLVKFYQTSWRHFSQHSLFLQNKSRLMRWVGWLCVYRCNPQYCCWPMAQLLSNHTINTFLRQKIHPQQ